MLYVDIPSREEFLLLSDIRADACISIYVETSPLRQELNASKIQLGNFIKEALQQLQSANFNKRRLALLEEELYSVLEDPDFWDLHAHSLAVLATPDSIRTYRLANRLSHHVEVADRFYLKPLLRALTFPHSAYILALSENEVRLIEFFADAPAEVITLQDLPANAASVLDKDSQNDRSHRHGAEDKKIRLAQYTRRIDSALRPLFAGHDYPLILVSAEPLASLYRSTNTIVNLTDTTLFTNAEHIGTADLVKQVRPLLDKYYQSKLDTLKRRFDARAAERRVTHDLSDAARAATIGAIELLMIDIDSQVAGTLDEQGIITFSGDGNSASYGVIDEIARRALATGAQVMAVRRGDLPGGTELSAMLRYPL